MVTKKAFAYLSLASKMGDLLYRELVSVTRSVGEIYNHGAYKELALVHIPDLTSFRYHEGPFDPEKWLVPLLYVGWLEHPQSFTTGNVTSTLLSKLNAMVSQSNSAYPGLSFLGWESCSFCIASGVPGWCVISESCTNIFVPGNRVVYVATGGILHYIETHSYLPPADFLAAVSKCPDIDSNEYRAALRLANPGFTPSCLEEVSREHLEKTVAAILSEVKQKQKSLNTPCPKCGHQITPAEIRS